MQIDVEEARRIALGSLSKDKPSSRNISIDSIELVAGMWFVSVSYSIQETIWDYKITIHAETGEVMSANHEFRTGITPV